MQNLEEIKDRLVAKKEKLLSRINNIEKDRRREKQGPINPDFAEQAVEVENNEVLDALSDLEREEIKKINTALVKIENGTYGSCMSCGEQISEARLTAMPFSSLCLECADE
ncbi:MAG: TraR/DksA family transcriptional regulator [Halobacteriovoraceae bacterium]|nr:TraR/DksA family transcriptional regulator [Halobacteriovoraceae bacterium]